MTGDRKRRRFNTGLVAIIIVLVILVAYGFYKPNDFLFSSVKTAIDKKSSITVLVVGDIMLDRNVRNIIAQNGFEEFFKGVKDLIKKPHIAVGNLEGPFTPYESLTASLKNKVLQFTFDPALAPALENLGFDILGLANNHTLNFGKEGLEMTRRYIGSSGMAYYGEPFNKNEISTIITKEGISVAFVGFHEFNYVNYENVVSEISRLRPQVDVVIVTPHWGEEYVKTPTERLKNFAHQFIDAGADVVIGTHPHIVMDVEMYNDKKIYYSLGNFVFDQYFSEDTMNGLVVLMNIDKTGENIYINFEDIPIRADREGVRVRYQ